MARVIVVGTGIAGLVTAYRASKNHDVVLVTKSELAESNTKYAQGGIAAVLFPDDSVASHVADTIAAGAGLCDADAVQVLCGEGPTRVRELIEWGVEFDRIDGELARGHEAAHSARRVIHAGGDATGLAIEVALLEAVKSIAVDVHDHTFMRDLLVENGRVSGIEVIDATGIARSISGDVVVIASGGAGQLYRHTTNPTVTTGDGIAAAYRAGAEIADVEFFQFHPTSLAVAGNPLISEAVRGEGAVLLDESGHRFMLDIHPDAELAPRDVVARGIARAMAAQGGRPVMLDATVLGETFLASRFPGISRTCTQNGFDWATEPIPVTPAAHYWMGGIRTDLDGRTSIPGLFAVGEASCTGVHGANRLASNSLLESLVFAWRASDVLDSDRPMARSMRDRETASADITSSGGEASFTRDQLQTLLWEHVGVERNASGLRHAASTLGSWAVGGESISDLEDRNLLNLARLMVIAALKREESRGAHYRDDFPDLSADDAHSCTWRGLTAPILSPREAVAR